jgi:nitrite reductase/ring-hydroxylating ferredoxin subunit
MAPLQEGAITSEDVAGTAVLFCKLDDIVYAYNSHCPHCRRPLAGGGLSARGLCCAGCGHSFDVRRAGRDLDQPGLHLEPYPLLYERGDLKVALHAA